MLLISIYGIVSLNCEARERAWCAYTHRRRQNKILAAHFDCHSNRFLHINCVRTNCRAKWDESIRPIATIITNDAIDESYDRDTIAAVVYEWTWRERKSLFHWKRVWYDNDVECVGRRGGDRGVNHRRQWMNKRKHICIRETVWIQVGGWSQRPTRHEHLENFMRF